MNNYTKEDQITFTLAGALLGTTKRHIHKRIKIQGIKFCLMCPEKLMVASNIDALVLKEALPQNKYTDKMKLFTKQRALVFEQELKRETKKFLKTTVKQYHLTDKEFNVYLQKAKTYIKEHTP